MNILSIQSHVSVGHVGNSASVFPLQLLGHEVWSVNTSQLSNHTGHKTVAGKHVAAAQIEDLILGIEDLGVFPNCDAIISGYVYDSKTVEVISDTVDRIKRANPLAIYLCDPVMGDDRKGLYVPDAVAEAITTLLIQKSDILTPNRFELSQLCDEHIHSVDHAAQALQKLTDRGPDMAICTSLTAPSSPLVSTLGKDRTHIWTIETPRLNIETNGAGDCLAAIFLGHLMTEHSFSRSLSLAVSAIHGILSNMTPAASDIPLIAAQKSIINPSKIFPACRIEPGTHK